MNPLPHQYNVQLAGGPAGYGALSTDGVPQLATAPPAEWGGPGDAWSPEHLLLASVEACFLFTLRAVARFSHVEFTSVDLFATGTVDRKDGVTRFTDIVLRPRVTVAAGTPIERVRSVLDKTGRSCLVSASLATPIRLEPEIAESPGGHPLKATA
jgi:organic hydroperoxide reductase OsmC/OhrA